MKIPKELEGARINVTQTAELFSMDAGHLRRLSRRGVLPAPKRTSKGMPFYDHDLLVQIAEVLRTGVGLNAEEIVFYRRKEKSPKKRRNRANGNNPQSADGIIDQVIEACKELGIAKDKLDAQTVQKLVTDEFGGQQPDLKDVIPVVARRLLKEE